MKSQRFIGLIRGYSIFLLCLIIFFMWGINLLSISQTDDTILESDPKRTQLIEIGGKSSFQTKPRPFLYYYFLELGYSVHFLQGPAESASVPLLVIQPPDNINKDLLQKIFSWVRNGGDLIIFATHPHPIDRAMGIDRLQNSTKEANSILTRLPYLDDVNSLSPFTKAMARIDGSSYYSVFPEDAGSTGVFYSYRGAGRVILVSHPDLLDSDGLKLNDNIVYITRLAEYLAPGKALNILDTDPTVMLKGRGQQMGINPAVRRMQIRKDHISLWSLLKANPISWVLLQLAIALAVYFASTSRRFGSPRSIEPADSAVLTYIKSMGELLFEQNDTVFALDDIYHDFLNLARKKFGLEASATYAKIVDAIRQTDSKTADSLTLIEHDVSRIISGREKSQARLLRVVRTLEQARKELKLYD